MGNEDKNRKVRNAWTDHLHLDFKFVCSSLGRTMSLPPSFTLLPLVLCWGWGLMGFSSWRLKSLFVSSLFSSWLSSHVGKWWEFMVIDIYVTRRYNLTIHSLIACLLQTSNPLFWNVPRVLDVGVFCGCIHCNWYPKLCISIFCGFCGCLSLCVWVCARVRACLWYVLRMLCALILSLYLLSWDMFSHFTEI